MYRVIRAFSDTEDNKYIYRVGDEYPRSGLEVSNERIIGLLGNGNKQGVPLIEGEMPAEEKPEKKKRKK